MRTQRRLGSVVALIVIALTGSLFVAAPAQAAPGNTPLEIEILKTDKEQGIFTTTKGAYNDDKGPAVDYFDDAVITARVTSNGAPVSDARVILQRQMKGSDTWIDFDYATYSDADGLVQQIWELEGPSKYRFYFDGESTPYVSAYSPEHSVKVMRDLNAESLNKNGKLIFKGKVAPKWKKKKVVLERKTKKNGKWKVVDKAKTNKRSKWSFRLGAPNKGAWYYRAWVPGKNGFVKSYSHIEVKTYKTFFRTQRSF